MESIQSSELSNFIMLVIVALLSNKFNVYSNCKHNRKWIHSNPLIKVLCIEAREANGYNEAVIAKSFLRLAATGSCLDNNLCNLYWV